MSIYKKAPPRCSNTIGKLDPSFTFSGTIPREDTYKRRQTAKVGHEALEGLTGESLNVSLTVIMAQHQYVVFPPSFVHNPL